MGKNLDSSCKIQKNIFFLKSSKTGSTTMMSIFQRFGLKYKSKFLPRIFKRTQPKTSSLCTPRFFLCKKICLRKTTGIMLKIFWKFTIGNKSVRVYQNILLSSPARFIQPKLLTYRPNGKMKTN